MRKLINHLIFITLFLFFSITDLVYGQTITVKKISNNQFGFLEGPVWVGDSVLYFTDLGTSPSRIFKYSEVTNKFTPISLSAGGANGLTLDGQGRIIACIGHLGELAILNSKGGIQHILTSQYQNIKYNSPNDLIVDRKGGIYFTDPAFGVPLLQDVEAVYYCSPDSLTTRVISDLQKPNGLVLSPDGSILYVVDTEDKYVFSYSVNPDGSLTNKKQFAMLSVNSGVISGADGMAIDTLGTIYVATNMGIQVITKNGINQTTLSLPEKPTNCDFGGKNMKTLYITAGTNLYSAVLPSVGYTVNSTINQPLDVAYKEFYQIKLFPNPAHERILLQYSQIPQNVIMMDIFGNVVQQFIPHNFENELHTNNLPKGLYIVKFITSKQIECKTVIIQ